MLELCCIHSVPSSTEVVLSFFFFPPYFFPFYFPFFQFFAGMAPRAPLRMCTCVVAPRQGRCFVVWVKTPTHWLLVAISQPAITSCHPSWPSSSLVNSLLPPPWPPPTFLLSCSSSSSIEVRCPHSHFFYFLAWSMIICMYNPWLCM